MTVEEREELPEGWDYCKLGEVITLINGRAYSQHEMLSEGTPILRIQNLNGGKNWFYSNLDLPDEKYCHAGDLLYAWSATFGPYWWNGNKSIFHYHIWNVRVSEAITKNFAYYELLRITDEVKAASHGVAMPHMTKSGMEAWEIMLPPLPEQIRIADKLDALLARVDAGRERLERVPKLVKQFRQAVLSAAVSGELTREWRGGGEAEWEEKRLSQVALSRLGKMLDQSKNTGSPTPYLRNVNVRWFSFRLDDVAKLRVEDAERNALAIRKGDVLICEGGEPGRCAVWDGEDDQYVYQKALHRVRASNELNPYWLTFCLKVSADSGRLEDYFTGTTIKHLTGASLAQLPLPLPPLPEQAEIVRRVEALFALADRLEGRYQSALTSFDRLTPALLAKAFRGELVPQDPEDEPAAVLLERIQARKAEGGGQNTRGRKPRTAGESGAEPKRRGRPPRAQAEGAEETAEPKRRGRPPGTRAIPTALNEEEAVRLLQERGQRRAEGSRLVGLFEE